MVVDRLVMLIPTRPFIRLPNLTYNASLCSIAHSCEPLLTLEAYPPNNKYTSFHRAQSV